MATFKGVVLPNGKRNDGTYNVKIRVIHGRKVRYIPTPFYVGDSQLTRGMKIKDKSVTDKIDARIRELRGVADGLGFLQDNMDIEQFVRILQTPTSGYDFFDFMRKHIASLRQNKKGNTADVYQTAYNSLYNYCERKPLPFESINKKFMLGYWDSTKSLTANTRRSYLTCIKATYRLAQRKLNDDDAGVVIVRNGVFDLIDLPPMESRNDLAFERVEDMQAVIDAPYTGSWSYDFAKDLFVLSFVLLGSNYADLLRAEKSDYKNGVITYNRSKVENRTSGKGEIRINVPEVGRIILEKYSGDAKYLIDFRGHPRTSDVPRRIHATFQNAGLEPMGENYLSKAGHTKGKYTFNSARHSMATYARNVCGIDKLTVHEMLNHSTPREYKITDVYLRKDYSHLWEANDKLMALFDWSFYEKQKRGQCGNCPLHQTT